MVRITFAKPEGGMHWVECQGMTYDPWDGYLMDTVRENSKGHGPCTAEYAPAAWQIVRVEEV